MADIRETYWQERFSESAAAADSENAANIYSPHGWRRRRDLFGSTIERMLNDGQLSPQARVLDMGCGTGAYSRALLDRDIGNVVGADLCGEMVRHARKRSGQNGQWLQANSLTVPFRDNSFDLVFSIGMIQHLSDLDSFFSECGRILRPGGTLMLMTLNRRTLLQALRACTPSGRQTDGTGEAALRRYVPSALRTNIGQHLAIEKTEVTPVMVLPNGLRWAELSVTPDSLFRGFCMPFSVSFILTVKTESPAH